MAHVVKTLVALVTLPGYGRVDAAQTTVTLSDEDFALIPSAAFSSNKVQDMGVVDSVEVQAVFVTNPAAVTSAQEATVNGSDLATTQALANSLKIKYNAAQVDIAALRAKLDAVMTALKVPGGPMAAS